MRFAIVINSQFTANIFVAYWRYISRPGVDWNVSRNFASSPQKSYRWKVFIFKIMANLPGSSSRAALRSSTLMFTALGHFSCFERQ